MTKKKISRTRQKIHEMHEQNEYASLVSNQNRAKSFSVGTTTGGIVEVSMRADTANLWYLLHPVEAVEVIEQIASAVGLQVALRPKQDFSTWRSWDTTIPGCVQWLGAAPWQMSDEQREYLTGLKEKNIEAIEGSKKDENKLEASKDESE